MVLTIRWIRRLQRAAICADMVRSSGEKSQMPDDWPNLWCGGWTARDVRVAELMRGEAVASRISPIMMTRDLVGARVERVEDRCPVPPALLDHDWLSSNTYSIGFPA